MNLQNRMFQCQNEVQNVALSGLVQNVALSGLVHPTEINSNTVFHFAVSVFINKEQRHTNEIHVLLHFRVELSNMYGSQVTLITRN